MKERMLELLLTAALVSLGACKGSGTASPGLSTRVDLYCSDLARYLEQAAETYAQLAPGLDAGQLTGEQRDRAASLFAVDGIGLSPEARSAKMQDTYKTFMFCIGVRQIDDQAGNEIEGRLARLNQALTQQTFDVPGTHQQSSHVDAAKQLRELAALAREVSRLPLKQ